VNRQEEILAAMLAMSNAARAARVFASDAVATDLRRAEEIINEVAAAGRVMNDPVASPADKLDCLKRMAGQIFGEKL
jgi:hypothetical protein